MELDRRRKLTEQSIQTNPFDVKLRRTERIRSDTGGWKNETITLPEQTFRMYLAGESTREIAKDGGTLQIKNREMLCPWNADIKKDDEFKKDGVDYRVAVVNPVGYLGEVVSYQCVVEEVIPDGGG